MNGRRRFVTALLGAWVALVAGAGAILAVAHSVGSASTAEPIAKPHRVVSTAWTTITVTEAAPSAPQTNAGVAPTSCVAQTQGEGPPDAGCPTTQPSAANSPWPSGLFGPPSETVRPVQPEVPRSP